MVVHGGGLLCAQPIDALTGRAFSGDCLRQALQAFCQKFRKPSRVQRCQYPLTSTSTYGFALQIAS